MRDGDTGDTGTAAERTAARAWFVEVTGEEELLLDLAGLGSWWKV